MAKLIASTLALITLGVCVINKIDPITTVLRGSIAFGIGFFLGAFWDGLWTHRHEFEPIRRAKPSQNTEDSAHGQDQIAVSTPEENNQEADAA